MVNGVHGEHMVVVHENAVEVLWKGSDHVQTHHQNMVVNHAEGCSNTSKYAIPIIVQVYLTFFT